MARGGRYLRIADPEWSDPLSPSYSRQRGGRWNPPGSFGVVYLNATPALARAQLRHKLEPRGIRPEDLDPEQAPLLVHTDVPELSYVDAVTDRGLASLDLPATYPLEADGKLIPHATCQPIGQAAFNAGEPGIACRSAAEPAGDEELAFFGRSPLRALDKESFPDWFW